MSSVNADGPRMVITGDDHRAVIVIVVAICVIWSMLVIAARMIWRFHQKSDTGFDDIIALVGTLFSVVQGGLTLGAVGKGFGQKAYLLDDSQIDAAGRYLYGATILYILTMCLSKASMPLLIARLTRDSGHLILSYVVLGVTAAWGLASVFALAFVCGIPVPWDISARSTCPRLFGAWIGVEATGLLIEALIVAKIVTLVQNLQMMVKFKVAVVGSFCLRALLVIPVAFRLNLLNKVDSSSQPLFENVNITIVTQIIVHYSLWAASFPCMRAFLRAFDTGMGVTTRVPTYKGSNYNEGSKGSSFAMRSFNRNNSSADPERDTSSPASPVSPVDASTREKITPFARTEVSERNIQVHGNVKDNDRRISDETASESSRKAIITRTVEWKINYEDAPMPGQAI